MKYSDLPGTYSGTGNATKTVALTGDQAIDGVLTTVAWGGTSIDYSFPTSNSVYGYAKQTDLPGGFFGRASPSSGRRSSPSTPISG